MSYNNRIATMIRLLQGQERIDDADRDIVMLFILRLFQMQFATEAGEACRESKTLAPGHCSLCDEFIPSPTVIGGRAENRARRFELGPLWLCWFCARAYGYREAGE